MNYKLIMKLFQVIIYNCAYYLSLVIVVCCDSNKTYFTDFFDCYFCKNSDDHAQITINSCFVCFFRHHIFSISNNCIHCAASVDTDIKSFPSCLLRDVHCVGFCAEVQVQQEIVVKWKVAPSSFLSTEKDLQAAL